jgi:hypothetical protein
MTILSKSLTTVFFHSAFGFLLHNVNYYHSVQAEWDKITTLKINRCDDENALIAILTRIHPAKLKHLSIIDGPQLSSPHLLELLTRCSMLDSIEIDIYPWSPRPMWTIIQPLITTLTCVTSFSLSIPGRFEFEEEWSYQTRLTSLCFRAYNSRCKNLDWLKEMTELRHLTLRLPQQSQTDLDSIGSVLGPLTKLTSLHMENASLEEFTPPLITNIKELALFEPTADKVVPYLSQFQSLRALTVLNFNDSTSEFWPAISTLTSLQRIHVQGQNGNHYSISIAFSLSLLSLSHSPQTKYKHIMSIFNFFN